MFRMLIKIVLLPIVLVLTVLVAFARFFCMFSGILLGVIAMIFFLLGVLLLVSGEIKGFIGLVLLAWAVSPYGLPGLVMWLTERVDDLNQMLKEI